MDIDKLHRELVQNLKKPGEEIVDEFNSDKADLLHMAVCYRDWETDRKSVV